MFKRLKTLFASLFSCPDAALFSPQQSLDQQRATLIRAHTERACGGLLTSDYLDCLAYAERTIEMVNNAQITLQAAYAQMDSHISRKRHRLLPPNVHVIKGAA